MMDFERVIERLRRVVESAFTAGPVPERYCIRRYDEYGNPHHEIDWSAIYNVYACAIYVRAPDYSRRLIFVPGAVVAYVVDGPRRYCAEYRTPEQVDREISQITPSWEIRIYDWPPNDIERAKAVCLR